MNNPGIPYDHQGQTHYLSGEEFRSVAATHSHEEYGFGVVHINALHGQVRTVALLIDRMTDHGIAQVMHISEAAVREAIHQSKNHRTWRWTHDSIVKLLSLSHLSAREAAGILGRSKDAVASQRKKLAKALRQLKAA